MEEKEKDIVVDGPGIVAEILNRMKPENKEKIVKAIALSNPTIATKIEEKLYRFDDLIDLTPQSVQKLIGEVDHRDIVISLKTASEKAKDALLQNMSDRKRELVQTDFQALPQMRLSDIEGAQRRILKKLDELKIAGVARTDSKHDVWV